MPAKPQQKSQYVPKEGQGSMFYKPPDERKSEKSPAWNGKVMIDGTLRWISAWEKDLQKGGYFLSISIGEPVKEG